MSTVGEVEQLAGAAVGSVCFVRDDVELHFGGPVLRPLAPSAVIDGDDRRVFPADGSRDALCRLIGAVVRQAVEHPDRLVLEFADAALPSFRSPAPVPVRGRPVRADKTAAAMITWENPGRDEATGVVRDRRLWHEVPG